MRYGAVESRDTESELEAVRTQGQDLEAGFAKETASFL